MLMTCLLNLSSKSLLSSVLEQLQLADPPSKQLPSTVDPRTDETMPSFDEVNDAVARLRGG